LGFTFSAKLSEGDFEIINQATNKTVQKPKAHRNSPFELDGFKPSSSSERKSGQACRPTSEVRAISQMIGPREAMEKSGSGRFPT
jgi:hypothetical protein